ncbi:MAG: ectoine/hydroxyectoine ABC transporter substrate-binding protein EhuB [Halofilum sp. (in: g-proteobacteria)]|nr:ectoine/hydroxyectoine ABC transporter substrate-binding protein EhuB [Halofilum sp. (in: g-proteobacteria)]
MISHAQQPVRMLLACLAIACAFAATAASAADLEELREAGTIRVAIADEKPYGYIDDDGNARGPGPDVARHVLGEIGIDDIEWVVTGFGDLIPGLQDGRFDMAAAEMAILPERCQKVIYSEPNTTYGEGLLVKAGNPHGLRFYSDFSTTAGNDDLRVAVLEGANQLGYLHKLGVPDDRIVTIESNEDAIEAITSGRANAYAATSLTVAGLAEQSNAVEPSLNFVDPVIDGKEVRGWGAFAFNKSSTDLRDAVNEVLVPYKYTDEWESTLRRYGFSKLDVLNSFKYDTEQLCNP